MKKRGVVGRAFASGFMVVLLLLVADPAWAQQWTTSGNDIYAANSGNVGVGTTAPASKLEVHSTSDGLVAGFRRTGATNNPGVWISVNETGSYANILGSGTTGPLDLRLGAGGIPDLFTLKSNGNVGVGTTSPWSRLSVAGDIRAGAGVGNGQITTRHIYGQETASDTYGPLYLNYGSSQDTYINDSGTGRVLLTGGNVGIGTTSPGQKLDVQGGNLNVTGGRITVSDTHTHLNFGGANYLGGDTEFRDASGSVTNALVNGAGTGTTFFAAAGGNVGIGTAMPAAKLDLSYDSSAVDALRFQDTNAGGRSWKIGSGTGVIGAFGFYDQSAGSVRVVIDGNGNVGVGTTGPLERFQTAGAIKFTSGAMTQNTASAGGLDWLSSGVRLFSWGADDSTRGTFQARAVTSGGASTRIWLEHLANGNTLLNQDGGNVGVGTVSPSSKLHVAGDVTVDGNISAKYQDIAEWVPTGEALSAGTVVVLEPRQVNRVVRSSKAYDTRVAGVISANPGIVLGEAGEDKVKVATTGRVKTRVDASSAPIEVGDLLVTGGKPGTAMKSQPVDVGGIEMHRPGTLLGKALEPLREGDGEILVLLSLQ